jgi:hypothetical protein
VSQPEDDYGRGLYTPLKAEHFDVFIRMHLCLAQAVMNKNSWIHQVYHYFDLTAGPAILHGQEQAPLLICKAAREINLCFNGHFIERDEERFIDLACNLLGNGFRSACHGLDHREILPGILREQLSGDKGRYLGLIYFDPNPGLEMIETFRLLADLMQSPVLKMMDLLFYLSATTVKRLRKVTEGVRLSDLLDPLNKKRWIIREPFGTHQWTFILLTNYAEMPEYKRIRFFATDKEPGKTFFNRMNLTERERCDDGPLLPWI